jgi:hypothetical protein
MLALMQLLKTQPFRTAIAAHTPLSLACGPWHHAAVTGE